MTNSEMVHLGRELIILALCLAFFTLGVPIYAVLLPHIYTWWDSVADWIARKTGL